MSRSPKFEVQSCREALLVSYRCCYKWLQTQPPTQRKFPVFPLQRSEVGSSLTGLRSACGLPWACPCLFYRRPTFLTQVPNSTVTTSSGAPAQATTAGKGSLILSTHDYVSPDSLGQYFYPRALNLNHIFLFVCLLLQTDDLGMLPRLPQAHDLPASASLPGGWNYRCAPYRWQHHTAPGSSTLSKSVSAMWQTYS